MAAYDKKTGKKVHRALSRSTASTKKARKKAYNVVHKYNHH